MNEPICEGIRPAFCRMFVCFNACKEGFLSGCSRFIGVDGTHLKGVYKGVLLTAMGIDAENHCFPLAYSIVGIENKENWAYFFNSLRAVIGDDLAGQYTLSPSYLTDVRYFYRLCEVIIMQLQMLFCPINILIFFPLQGSYLCIKGHISCIKKENLHGSLSMKL